MVEPVYKEKFSTLFKNEDWDRINQIPEVDLAGILPDLTIVQQDYLLQNQSLERVSAILSEADEAVVKPLLDRWTTADVADVVKTLDLDDGVDLLATMPEQKSRKVLNLIEEDQAYEVEKLLNYHPESAGGLMTPDCIRLPESYSVEEALRAVRDGLDAEMVHYIYVLDSRERLRGIVSMRDLLNAHHQSRLEAVMTKDFVSVNVLDDKEDVAEVAKKYNFVALPVVDNEGFFKGIITVDDILDVVDQEASEDMFRLAGTGMGSPTLEPIWNRVAKRMPYLLITLVGGGIAAKILHNFKHLQQMDELAALSYFIPVVIGMAGNVGIQSSTVVVRGIATGEITQSRFLKVLRHELGVGLSLSFLFCVISAFVVYWAHAYLDVHENFGLVVGIGMAAGIAMASFIGTSVPLVCEKIGIDPALAAGPFVTTSNDVVGVFVYLQIAQWLHLFFLHNA